MNKKLIIGGIVLLLVIGGGAFLLLSRTETKSRLGKTESDTVPTKWSQAGDYEIKEVAGQQTVVTNSKAGFSFKVPENWRVETDQLTKKEFFINLLSPDAVKKEFGSPLSEGCGIGLNTFFQEDQWFFWNNLVVGYQEEPGKLPKEDGIIKVDNYFAIQTTLITETDAIREKVGDNIQVRIPISNNGVIEFGMNIMLKHQDDCLAEFDNFLSGFSIK